MVLVTNTLIIDRFSWVYMADQSIHRKARQATVPPLNSAGIAPKSSRRACVFLKLLLIYRVSVLFTLFTYFAVFPRELVGYFCGRITTNTLSLLQVHNRSIF